MRFCKTEIRRKSDEIESIYQSKSGSPLIADKGDEEGVCYFLRSRLPTAQGTVNGKKVIALRDTGCTGCVVRRNLVSSDQLLGKESDVTLIVESTQRYPLAMVEMDCPFFTGKTEALCMDDTLYDLVIGNIDGSKLPDMSHFLAAAVTRAQANQEKAYRKLNVPDQIISKDKEAFKQAQPFRVVLGWAYRGLTGGFLLLQNFCVAISVSPHVCFILVLILISMFLR